ncbi:hypothetical protein [Mucilaginibacter panaciglaebae]|uniref:Uncharacterized protein n=1 Tax=Mucilaginibacter panaciglaebae TaxID=502331 RepID=A0ABP7WFC8_9SPHI
MKKLIVASAIVFSTGIANTSFAAAIKEKNTLGTADRTGEKSTLDTTQWTAGKNIPQTADRC